MRNHGRTDDNHAAIVRAFRRVPGVRVCDLSGVGGGVPDLLISNRGDLALVEIKCEGPPSRQRLTPDQVKFHAIWPVSIITSEAEAMALLGWAE